MPRRGWDFSETLSRGFVQILQRAPSPGELRAFSRYLSLLLQWDRAHHLTGYRTPPEITEKLFLDSLLFLRWISSLGGKLLDLGAGAGVPGIPLKIVEPRFSLTLLEARRRRISFLATAVRGLELEGVHLLHGRAESLIDSEPGLRGAFDTVVTRAAGPPGLILPLALAFLKPGGRFIASGPPAEKPAPPLPQDTSYRWESVLTPGGGRSRRFLIAEKT